MGYENCDCSSKRSRDTSFRFTRIRGWLGRYFRPVDFAEYFES